MLLTISDNIKLSDYGLNIECGWNFEDLALEKRQRIKILHSAPEDFSGKIFEPKFSSDIW